MQICGLRPIAIQISDYPSTQYVFVHEHDVGFEPYLFDLRVILEDDEPYAYPRLLAMVDSNISANEQEWREDLVTSSEEVETHSSSVDIPHNSRGLEVASSDENMSSNSRSPTWREQRRKRQAETNSECSALFGLENTRCIPNMEDRVEENVDGRSPTATLLDHIPIMDTELVSHVATIVDALVVCSPIHDHIAMMDID